MNPIPGHRLRDPALPASSVAEREFEELKASLLFGPADVAALRRARSILAPQVEAILDVWYGFVGATPHLLAQFADTHSGQPDAAYLAAVRKRFGQWILDTCAAEYDKDWLAWMAEIGRRHHRTGKNRTDGAHASAHVPMRDLLALVYPISATVRPFLSKTGASAADVEEMHAAWTKSVLMQAILWAVPYAKDGDF